MELKLQRELFRLKPELTIEQLQTMSHGIADYWISQCLPDVLEAGEVA